MARDLVPAPTARPPLYSLLVAAPVVEDDSRWQGGFEFAPEACSDGGRTGVECWGGTAVIDPAANPRMVGGEPFAVWAADACSTFGYRARDYVGRARRQLLAIQSFQIAEELWEGSLNGEPSMGGQVIANTPLTAVGSDTVTNGPTSATGALAQLVDALGQCGQGRQGMIHMTPQLLVHLAALGAVFRDGGLWVTPMGHIVVADDGYPGSGPGATPVPAGASQWMYGTSMMFVRLSPIETLPNLPDDDTTNPSGWPAAVDPRTNDVLVIAQRLAAVEWDQCCHVAAEVDLAVPLIGGAS